MIRTKGFRLNAPQALTKQVASPSSSFSPRRPDADVACPSGIRAGCGPMQAAAGGVAMTVHRRTPKEASRRPRSFRHGAGAGARKVLTRFPCTPGARLRCARNDPRATTRTPTNQPGDTNVHHHRLRPAYPRPRTPLYLDGPSRTELLHRREPGPQDRRRLGPGRSQLIPRHPPERRHQLRRGRGHRRKSGQRRPCPRHRPAQLTHLRRQDHRRSAIPHRTRRRRGRRLVKGVFKIDVTRQAWATEAPALDEAYNVDGPPF